MHAPPVLFDALSVSSGELCGAWRAAARASCTALPAGTVLLRFGTRSSTGPWDVGAEMCTRTHSLCPWLLKMSFQWVASFAFLVRRGRGEPAGLVSRIVVGFAALQ